MNKEQICKIIDTFNERIRDLGCCSITLVNNPFSGGTILNNNIPFELLDNIASSILLTNEDALSMILQFISNVALEKISNHCSGCKELNKCKLHKALYLASQISLELSDPLDNLGLDSFNLN